MSHQKLFKGLTEEVIDRELAEDAPAWVICEEGTEAFLVTPDPRYTVPVVQFFMKVEDAEQFIEDVKAENEALRNQSLLPMRVPLKESMRRVTNADPPCAIILHSPNAMYEWQTHKRENVDGLPTDTDQTE